MFKSRGNIGISMDEITQIANKISEELNADILFLNTPIERPNDDTLIEMCLNRKLRKNIFVILITEGGDADAAFRMARILQNTYEKFFIFVSGYCKSAGTLITLGAHELIISDYGQLGPLDVQMAKRDELQEYQSGLTVMNALETLQNKAFSAFEKFFLDLKVKSGGVITLKTSTEIASSLTNGLFGPIFNQIDPMHIGEAGRSMSIAIEYGKRLADKTNNIDLNCLYDLIAGYPSHSFVIDRDEASTLFNNVRAPNDLEMNLVEKLGGDARVPSRKPIIAILSTDLDKAEESDNAKEEKNNEINTGEESGLGESPESTGEKPRLKEVREV
jgi:hypothetical protein